MSYPLLDPPWAGSTPLLDVSDFEHNSSDSIRLGAIMFHIMPCIPMRFKAMS